MSRAHLTYPLQLQHPIVLVHGLGSKSKYGPFDYFFGIPKHLTQQGNEVFVPNLTAWQSVEHRAEELKAQIEEKFPAHLNQKINLISHSRGGLDCRYLISCLGFSDRVASLVSIGVPNRGTVLADIVLGIVPDSTFRLSERLLGLLGSSSEGLSQITREYCEREFNPKVVDSPRVKYYSATSTIREPIKDVALPFFWISTKVLERYEGENDGFVSLHSAKWGTHICTPVGDHYAQVGHFLGRTRGLDYLAFWNEIIQQLRQDGL